MSDFVLSLALLSDGSKIFKKVFSFLLNIVRKGGKTSSDDESLMQFLAEFNIFFAFATFISNFAPQLMHFKLYTVQWHLIS